MAFEAKLMKSIDYKRLKITFSNIKD